MISVVIVTYFRNPPLLSFIIQEWSKIGVEVVLVSDLKYDRHPFSGVNVSVFHETSPMEYGNAIQAGLDACTNEFAYLAADDILPVWGWDNIPYNLGSITAISLRNTNGKRYYDWAYVDGDIVSKKCTIHLQGGAERRPQTYITGGAQIIHLTAVRDVGLSYKGGIFRESEDVLYCFEAEKRGIKLIPPSSRYPLCIHLNEKE